MARPLASTLASLGRCASRPGPSQPLRPLLNSFRYAPLLAFSAPFTLPTRTLFGSAPPPGAPQITRSLLRQPFSGAPRECPTPIILVRGLGIGSPSDRAAAEDEQDWENWGGMFSQRGYTILEVDITAPTTEGDTGTRGSEAASPLQAMSTLLASQIRLLAIPFPPILISSGPSCLLTQTYVEDNPASGLVLIDPPPDRSQADASSASIFGSAKRKAEERIPQFTFEPAFPVLLVSPAGRLTEVKASRLGQAEENGVSRGGKGVVVQELVDGPRGEKSRIVVERWMDQCGF